MNTNVTPVVDEEEGTFAQSRLEVEDKFAKRRVRHGKTKRERENGVLRQRITNLEERAAWINETRGKNTTPPPMPKPHGLGNSSKRFKIKPAPRSKG